jgi:hypothetical protein
VGKYKYTFITIWVSVSINRILIYEMKILSINLNQKVIANDGNLAETTRI